MVSDQLKNNDLEFVTCNICNSNSSKSLFIKEGLRIVRCDRCGLIYINPRRKEEKTMQFYSDTKYIPDKEFCECHENAAIKNAVDRIKAIKKWKSHGKLLDIGSGLGYFLSVAAKSGYEVVGVEPSLNYSEYARNKLGVNVHTGTLRQVNFDYECFDIVTLYHVLEHMSDPAAELIEVYRILKKNGLLVIEVPNIDSLKAKFSGKNWSCIVKEHLYYFSPGTLKKILEKTGFSVREISWCGSGLGMVTCLEKHAPPKIVKSYVKYLEHIIKIYKWTVKIMRIDEGIRVYGTKV